MVKLWEVEANCALLFSVDDWIKGLCWLQSDGTERGDLINWLGVLHNFTSVQWNEQPTFTPWNNIQICEEYWTCHLFTANLSIYLSYLSWSCMFVMWWHCHFTILSASTVDIYFEEKWLQRLCNFMRYKTKPAICKRRQEHEVTFRVNEALKYNEVI